MITTLVYRDHKFAAQNPPITELSALRAEPGVMLWVDLAAPSEEEIKFVLDYIFQFHPLAIEDCVTDSPLPKLEAYDDYLYLVMHAVDYTQAHTFRTTELDLFLGKNFLVTFHRNPLRPVEITRERLLKNTHQLIRGPDRFAHTILDQLVDAYRPALDALRAQIEAAEESVLQNIKSDELFPLVVALRKQLSQLRQIVRPQREIAYELSLGKQKLIRPVIVPYLRDLAEELGRIESHAIAWSDQLILSFRIYLNKSSHEANTGIRILTGITALTFPTFLISAWYGMNFEHMDELAKPYAYASALALNLTLTGIVLAFMRRKKWL